MTTTLSLRDTVSEKLAAISPEVEAQVIEIRVKRELNKRADIIGKGIDELDRLDREFNKTNRPDQQAFNADGSSASETYSKAKIEEIKKLEGRREKLTKAIDKALSGDMNDLINLTANAKPETNE